MESSFNTIRKEQQRASRRRSVVLVVMLILVSAAMLPIVLPVIGFIGPLLLERTISVPITTLNQIPARFHPHFAPNAVNISGQYPSVTRKCAFEYSCTIANFEAFIDREKLAPANQLTLDEGPFATGRQWGPSVASYHYFPYSETATVSVSAW